MAYADTSLDTLQSTGPVLDKDEVVDVLNDLLENSRDGEYGFRACADEVESPAAKQLFANRAEECRKAGAEVVLHQLALDAFFFLLLQNLFCREIVLNCILMGGIVIGNLAFSQKAEGEGAIFGEQPARHRCNCRSAAGIARVSAEVRKAVGDRQSLIVGGWSLAIRWKLRLG